MNPTLNRMLGGGQMALGTMSGNPGAMMGGMRRMTAPQPQITPTGNVIQMGPPAPPLTSDAVGGDLSRPTLMRPGERAQQIDMGPAPTRPGFKFPSTMWTE